MTQLFAALLLLAAPTDGPALSRAELLSINLIHKAELASPVKGVLLASYVKRDMHERELARIFGPYARCVGVSFGWGCGDLYYSDYGVRITVTPGDRVISVSFYEPPVWNKAKESQP